MNLEFLHLAWRQEHALHNMAALAKSLLAGGLPVRRLLATLMALVEMFCCVVFDTPVSPTDRDLDLTGYTLVFEDEFEGDSLDTDAWFVRGNGPVNCGYQDDCQVKVENGNLVLTGGWREDGAYGPGWYAAEVALKQLYCRGYFECRAICSKSTDYWSAFWIQSPNNPYDHYISQGGVNGAEIDIMESMSADNLLPVNQSSISTTIHCNGYDDDIENIDSRLLGVFKGKNIYTEYNTYGLEWTEDEYIFYINGKETVRSSFASGVSQIAEYVILSMCTPGEINQDKDYSVDFIVDSVRIYQK